MTADGYSAADLHYVRAHYFTLEELCADRVETAAEARSLVGDGLLPAPSYVLPDGTEMFPADLFVLPDQARKAAATLRAHFDARYRAAGGAEDELEPDWRGYMDGIFGVCLRNVLPETMVRKAELVDSLTRLLSAPIPDDAAWRSRLRREVWELDALERPFAPDFDRSGRLGQPPTRDLLIEAARGRFPELFATEAA
jgi:hypothetical protein